MRSTANPVQRSTTTDPDDLIPIERVEDIPEFATAAEEAAYWDTHDTSLIWDQLEDVTHNPPPGLHRRTDPLGSRAGNALPSARWTSSPSASPPTSSTASQPSPPVATSPTKP